MMRRKPMKISTKMIFALMFFVLPVVAGCDRSAQPESGKQQEASENVVNKPEKVEVSDDIAQSPLNENANDESAKKSHKADEREPETMPLVNAEGTVVYNGKPVTGAKVKMTSEEGVAIGTTDADGKFKMTVAKDGKVDAHAPIGTLKVTISKEEAEIDPSGSDDELQNNVIPPKFSDPNGTELKIEILKSGKTDIKIDLTDD